MGKMWIVAQKDIREAFVSRSTYSYLIILVIVSFPYFMAARNVIETLVNEGVGKAGMIEAAQATADSIFYTYPLILIMLVCGVFSAYAVIVDKSKRALESLLASPLSLRQVWIGKALAVTVPSVSIGLVIAVLMMVVLNIFVFMPVTGIIIPGFRSLIGGFILVPLITFCTVMLVTFLQLVMTNPRLASLVFTVVFLGIYFTTIMEIVSQLEFALVYLGVIVVLFVAIFIVSRFLTKERIVLSSKT